MYRTLKEFTLRIQWKNRFPNGVTQIYIFGRKHQIYLTTDITSTLKSSLTQ